MNHYSLIDSNSRYMFPVVCGVAMDILYIFLAMSDPYLGAYKKDL
jgi:hypothetical protein